ncbi:MAG: hypothetical protein WBG90_04910 [Saonia sp.]
MNSLSRIDQDLLEHIKKQIAIASGLDQSSSWAQKDYDFLVFFIEEQSGVRLSLSTVKRIWRNEYHRLPHISTLDILSKLAYKKDWLSLKKQWLEEGHGNRSVHGNSRRDKRNPVVYLIALLLVILAFSVGLPLVLDAKDKVSVADKERVTFSYEKSVEGEIPNTVVFRYNVESVKADRFFLQQNWDEGRRVEIFRENREKTDIYYIPGYFTAKLIADTEVLREIPIHVTYENWFIAARQPFSRIKAFDKKYWVNEQHLGVDQAALESKKIDVAQDFQLSFYYVKEFDLDGDNFTYTTSFKMIPLDAVACPQISLHVQGDKGYYWIMFGKNGCESELDIRLGDVLHEGKNQDLTMFGTNMYQWQQVDIAVVDKKVKFQLNGKNIFSSTYNKPIGAIKEISYFFNGIGMIDSVALRNVGREVKFFDDFD